MIPVFYLNFIDRKLTYPSDFVDQNRSLHAFGFAKRTAAPF